MLGGEQARSDAVIRAHCRKDLDVGVHRLTKGQDFTESLPSCFPTEAILGRTRSDDDLERLVSFVCLHEGIEQGSVDGSGSVHGNDDATGSIRVEIGRGDNDHRAVRRQRHLARHLTAGELADPRQLVTADHQHGGLS